MSEIRGAWRTIPRFPSQHHGRPWLKRKKYVANNSPRRAFHRGTTSVERHLRQFRHGAPKHKGREGSAKDREVMCAWIGVIFNQDVKEQLPRWSLGPPAR